MERNSGVKRNFVMDRKQFVAGILLAIAVLLPLGNWVLASRQDAEDQKRSAEVQKQFVAQRASASGQTASTGATGAWGGQRGQRRPGGRQRWGTGQRGQGRGRMMAEMAKAVGLTPTQMQQIQAVQDSTRPMMMDIRRNPQLTREQKRAQMQQMRQAQQAAMAKFMTADQQSKYTAFQQQMRQRWQSRMQQGGGFGGPGGSGPGAGSPVNGPVAGGPANGTNGGVN